MRDQKCFDMSGSIGGSLAGIGASPLQLMDVGGLSGPPVLSASDLAARLEELPPECGGREPVAALRALDPDVHLVVTPDGPVELGNARQHPTDLVHAQRDALAADHGYDSEHWTPDELAIAIVQTAPALDGVDPVSLEPACAAWLQRRRK